MKIKIHQRDDILVGHFKAMASPCEILIESTDLTHCNALVQLAAQEAWRIESKFSRYKTDNIIFQINNAQGETIEVDTETADLLDFAAECFNLSNGLFDITSGVLREAWTFDGSNKLPAPSEVNSLLELIGWEKLSWDRPFLTLPPDMQLDFGGIGKEYAVDKVLVLLKQQTDNPLLVNFGGDLHASDCRRQKQPWITGIENPSNPGGTYNTLELYQGALATSGDVFRYLEKEGIRYGHILNPKTGWPVIDAPHSITVAATNCTEAGIMATLAMLHGEQAEQFLQTQNIKYWAIR